MAGPLRCRPAFLTVKSLIHGRIVTTGTAHGTTGDGRVTTGKSLGARHFRGTVFP